MRRQVSLFLKTLVTVIVALNLAAGMVLLVSWMVSRQGTSTSLPNAAPEAAGGG